MRKMLATSVLVLLLAMSSMTLVAAQGEGTVTVVHGVPGLIVDVYVDGDLTLEGFEPGTATDPLMLPAGDYDIDIRAAGEDEDADPTTSASATLPAGANVAIVAHLDANGAPTLSVFVNDVAPIAAGNSRLTARHTAAAPAVDILASDMALFSRLSNGNQVSADVPADTYSVAVAAAGTTEPVLGPGNLTLEAGTAYFVYAVGSPEDGSLDLLVDTVTGLGHTPGQIAAGSSGIADQTGMSLIAMALVAVVVAGLAVSGVTLARQRR